MQPVLINGEWRTADAVGDFGALNPATGEELASGPWPVSSAADVYAAVVAAREAFEGLRRCDPEARARFLEAFADRIEANADAIAEAAHRETALPVLPRLRDVELPRTTGQLRQAAAAIRDGAWALATIDTTTNIRSQLAAIGPVLIFGPNNFPLAFNAISGGDFAAAIAAGNPVIAKGHPGHPETTRQLAALAHDAVLACDLPPATVQLLYALPDDVGLQLAGDARLGAVAFTGSRASGMRIKAAADAAGIPVFLEMSALNPVVLLPGALAQRADDLATEFAGSCLLGAGQFCTNPGLVVLIDGDDTRAFVDAAVQRFRDAAAGTLLGPGVRDRLSDAVKAAIAAGAELLVGGEVINGDCKHENTLLRSSAATWRSTPELREEMFGPVSMLVVAADEDDLLATLATLDGSLTGCVYSHTDGADDALYERIEPVIRTRVGRLLNDRMPTGVAVSPAMNHGGPFPSTGHPGFTAVGIPASLRRFAMLQCYDNVRPHRLPEQLRDDNPRGIWRHVDGVYTRDPVRGG